MIKFIHSFIQINVTIIVSCCNITKVVQRIFSRSTIICFYKIFVLRRETTSVQAKLLREKLFSDFALTFFNYCFATIFHLFNPSNFLKRNIILFRQLVLFIT